MGDSVTVMQTVRYSLAVKTANEIVNNSTTLQADDELKVYLPANTKWYIEGHLMLNSPAAADWKYNWSLPAGATGYGSFVAMTAAGALAENQTSGASVLDYLTWSGQQCTAVIRVLVQNGATAGYATLQWAQNTATVGDTTVYAGSVLLAWQLV